MQPARGKMQRIYVFTSRTQVDSFASRSDGWLTVHHIPVGDKKKLSGEEICLYLRDFSHSVLKSTLHWRKKLVCWFLITQKGDSRSRVVISGTSWWAAITFMEQVAAGMAHAWERVYFSLSINYSRGERNWQICLPLKVNVCKKMGPARVKEL